ncbi:SIMPL domain-containing protein [Microbacterium hominis]|uniref:SIMPL domain-containing protein n=1 Tax=Microbacterium hominis TaxID=162426 RepID=A0A7D4Q223_9MICO|nr:SIMPL domain-containing protein [Microbacterium hominis]QKJ19191.1 SIMPL domain-containing protein [Microbacterium hominis]
MSEVVITVRGEHESRVAPEHGTVALAAHAEGPARGAVVERIAALGEPLRAELAERAETGEVSEWSSERVAVWSERPWNAEGTRLAPVHHARLQLSATFTDFAALSWWAGEIAERDGVEISHVSWDLTRETRAAVERQVAADAVAVAVARATAYARALGLSDVSPREVADLGLLAHPRAFDAADGAPRAMFAAAAMPEGAGGAGIELQPQDLVVRAAVEARFTAR